MADAWLTEAAVPCRVFGDPECGGSMEPEEDGDHRYWACTTCGYEGGYQKAEGSAAMCATGQAPKPQEPSPLF